MVLTVNGEKREIEDGSTLAGLLRQLQVDPAKVAVERNAGIVSRSQFVATILQRGDQLEIVQFVGGG